MAKVTAPARAMQNGEIVTQFNDTVSTTATTFTYPNQQERLSVSNKGSAVITLTVNGVNYPIQPEQNQVVSAVFSSFVIQSTSGIQHFQATASNFAKTDRSRCYFQKTGNEIYMYKPSKTNKDRYIKLRYLKQVISSIYADIWRTVGIWTSQLNADGTFTDILCWQNETEIEGVFKETGAGDFTGGYHGNEKTISINVFVDGKPIDMTRDYSLRQCDTIDIMQETEMYRYSDHVTVLFNRSKRVAFDKDKFTIDNMFKAPIAFNMIRFFPVMFSVFNETESGDGQPLMLLGAKDNRWTPHSLQDSANNILTSFDINVRRFKMWNPTRDISVTVSVWNEIYEPDFKGYIQTTPYPKIYAGWLEEQIVAAGAVYNTRGIYELEC